jgi:TetR/AcrR family transcriptional repressor of nem operon
MARPQEFDRREVITRAMNVFWRKGFEATSIQDLVAATKLNRGSLYNAFGDKAGLFAAVMEAYAATAPASELLRAIETGGPARQAIETFFAALVERGTADKERRGCLIVNTASELVSRDPRVAQWMEAAARRREQALTALVERGQAAGEIAPWRDARALGRFLFAAAQGLIVTGKMDPDQAVLEDVADMALSLLD